MGSHGERFPRAFQAPVDVHASADGQVYVFRGARDDSAESSEEELGMVQRRPRGCRSGQGQEQARVGGVLLLERPVSHGDSLNKLALQYGCKVADIKQLNNLIREQDLYALKSIKIPVKKHGLLTELNNKLISPHPESHLPSSQGTATPHLPDYADFLKEIDRDIERLIQTTDSQDEVPSSGPGVPQQTPGAGSSHSHGADWGIQWWNAVVLMLLIGVILPLFYVVYYKTQDKVIHPLESMVNTSMSTSNGTETNGSLLSHTLPSQ
ncbi:lysM and putative peptidoglycan-binding domain-containing protein 4 [Paramormyrops kingsleyae]|uniref:LysM and putative peptidoglycan-binding domain-containing protein 4 n=1 Tax=Paramormyrops kingsleyae TaxID=1676925 RepID=A0A3B3SRZ6_9TELE|nr:lysM and putative peptidoglycan-binding domain-containing protein 4 [Paramormyrops kingsleyae]XP_023670023.1 lysM and putative peptidoglycan-binding domain-containing protein 4 [Paramormyrops kingsleyae]